MGTARQLWADPRAVLLVGALCGAALTAGLLGAIGLIRRELRTRRHLKPFTEPW